jgi:hypothetical protein
LTKGFTGVLASGEGEAGDGVAVTGTFGVELVFPFELFSVLLGSQAATASDKSITAKSFFVMIVSIRLSGRLPLEAERRLPSSLGEWWQRAKRFMLEATLFFRQDDPRKHPQNLFRDRGRTASYPTAPAQIPACSFPAPGSS